MYKYLAIILLGLIITGLLFTIYQLKLANLKALLLTYGVGFMAMLVFNTYLTSLPIVMYNTSSILRVYLSSFPIEDIGYLIIVVLLAPSLFEHFSNEKISKK